LLLHDEAKYPSKINLPDSDKTMRIRIGFGALSSKRLESHLNHKISLDLPEDNYLGDMPTNSDELAGLYTRTASHEICNLLLSHVSQAMYANSESNPLLQWHEDETERLKSYGLTDEDTQTLLDTVLADDQKGSEPILNQLRVPNYVIRIKDENKDSNP
jgi:hypothetical protein